MLQGVLSRARPQIASLTSMQCGSSPAWHIQSHGKLSQRARRRGLLAGCLQDIIPGRQLGAHAAMPLQFPLPSALLPHRLTGTFMRSSLHLIDRGTEALPSSATRNMNGNLISCHCMPQPFDRLSAWNVKQTASVFVVPTRSTR